MFEIVLTYRFAFFCRNEICMNSTRNFFKYMPHYNLISPWTQRSDHTAILHVEQYLGTAPSIFTLFW